MKRREVLLGLLSVSAIIGLASCGGSKKKHTHSFDEGVVTAEATCTEDGVKTFSCKCGETKTEAIPKTGHNEVIDAAVDPTCTEEGLTEGKHCETCNSVLVEQKTVEAKGHDYKAIYDADHMTVVKKSGDYILEADYDMYCDDCNAISPDKEHAYAHIDIIKEPGLTTPGEIEMVMADSSKAVLVRDTTIIPIPSLEEGFWSIEKKENSCYNVKATVTSPKSITPAPPVGPFYGSKGINIMQFINLYHGITNGKGISYDTVLEEWHNVDVNGGKCKDCGHDTSLEVDMTSPLVNVNLTRTYYSDDLGVYSETLGFQTLHVINASGLVEVIEPGVTKGAILRIVDKDGEEVSFDNDKNTFEADIDNEYYVSVYKPGTTDLDISVRLAGERSSYTAAMYILSKDEGGRRSPIANLYRANLVIDDSILTCLTNLPSGIEYIAPGSGEIVNITLPSSLDLLSVGDTFLIKEGTTIVGIISLSDKVITNLDDLVFYNSRSLIDGTKTNPFIKDSLGNYYSLENNILKMDTAANVVGYELLFDDCLYDGIDCIAVDTLGILEGYSNEELSTMFVGKKAMAKEYEAGSACEVTIVSLKRINDNYYEFELSDADLAKLNGFVSLLYIAKN